MAIKTPFHYFPFGTVSGYLLTLTLSCLYAFAACLKLLLDRVQMGGWRFYASVDRTGPNRPTTLDDYGTHEIIRLPKQAINLHYVSSGSEEKQLMLFVHGFPECWFSWRHQMKAFKNRYHTVAVNLRGYGESEKPEGVEHYSTDLIIADVIELIEILISKSKASKCILVAHDWGGIIAWVVAQQRPDLVDRFIVLNAPHPVCWSARIASTWRQFASSWYMFFFNFPWVAELYFRRADYASFEYLLGAFQTPEETAVYKHYYNQPYGITGPLNFYRASLRGYGSGKTKRAQVDLAKNKIEPPTMIIWATEDEYLISELATDSAKLCEDATVQYVEKCSHWVMLERPEEVNEIMGRFLSKEK